MFEYKIQTSKNVLKAKIYKQTKIYFLNENKLKLQAKNIYLQAKKFILTKQKIFLNAN